MGKRALDEENSYPDIRWNDAKTNMLPRDCYILVETIYSGEKFITVENLDGNLWSCVSSGETFTEKEFIRWAKIEGVCDE